jgi:site-specific recombinase XerD
MSALAPTLQAFFTDRLVRQRQVSPHTLAAYRDTMRLLVRFATARRGVEPSKLEIDDLDATVISAFLDHREHDQGNSIRTRNARLAAIRSLFRFAALRHPEHAAVIGRVLAIPPKRFERRLVTFLTEPEIDALLAAPARTTWTGRRDHTLLALAVQTGLRVSELIALRNADVHLGVGPHVSCLGKGRKHRITPLTAPVVAVLRSWLVERAGQMNDPLFRREPAERSAATPSNIVSGPTSRPPWARAHRWATKRSRSMSCVTPRPCACCTPVWIRPLSPSGSGTSKWKRLRSTCTRISR